MTHDELLTQLRSEELSPDDVFRLVRSISYFYQRPSSDQTQALDLIIRLLEARSEYERQLPGVAAMIDAVAREAGLYPYIAGRGGWRDELALELMRAPGMDDIIFHIEQALVFNKLAEGRSIILSAPTSFGKSLLIDALIAHRSPSTVLAVVPTIALLDEFRRRMERRFPVYQVLTRSGEVQLADKAIYIGTQERLLERAYIPNPDLFIIDEFYKLDLDRGDKRSLALNAILAKYGKTAKQIYLLGPSIDDVPNAESFRSGVEFVKTRYSPVTADIVDRTAIGPSPSQLIEDLGSIGITSSLVYVQSPPAASRLAFTILDDSRLARRTPFCEELSAWLAEHFHPEWVLAKSVDRGIGIHHGRIPRSIAHLIITLFNRGDLAAIICTSSMIEGINTAAENVFIYDRNISTSKLDRFTFDNIKGRAGRLFKHNIGKVFLYNNPPEESQYDVRVPLFGTDELMTPELLVQVGDLSLTDQARRRKRAIVEASGLPIEILSRWSEFGIDKLNALASYLMNELQAGTSLLLWNSVMPTFDELEATFSVLWNILDFKKHDIRSPRQLAMFANRLRVSESVRHYIDGLVSSTGLAAQQEIDRCFNFMRGAEYTFPQVLRATNDIVDVIVGEGVANYRVYAAELQNVFLPGQLRALDELGVPLPLVRRLSPMLPKEDVNQARSILTDPVDAVLELLTPFERSLVSLGLG